MVNNPTLRAALLLAYDGYPPIRPLIERAASSGVRVIVAQPSDADAAGSFDSNSRLITVAPSVLYEPAAVAAAVLVHEITHSAQAYEPGAQACYAHEGVAYSWQAAAYEALRTGRESTPFAHFQEELVQSWRAGQLTQFVYSRPLYRRQCLGGR
jgi:hypothetical protein